MNNLKVLSDKIQVKSLLKLWIESTIWNARERGYVEDTLQQLPNSSNEALLYLRMIWNSGR